MMVLSPFFILFSDEKWSFLPLLAGFYVLGIIYLKLGIARVTHKRQAIETRARESARSDPRGFFLLLRSFSQTEPYETYGTDYALPGITLPMPGVSVLPILDRALSNSGRLVLIGAVEFDDTGKSWTAIQVRCKGDNWREVFRILSAECRAVILIPGSTPGSYEEIQDLVSGNLLNKTIVFVPRMIGGDAAHVDHVDDRIRKEKLEAWDALQTRLARSGMKLPVLETNGYFYLPNTDLSVRRKVAIDVGFAETGEQIRSPLRKSCPAQIFPGAR